MVDSSEQVTAHTEEIDDEAVDREKPLRVRGGLEPAHLSFALPRGLMRDLVTDNLGWESVSVVAWRVVGHRRTLPAAAST